MLRPIVFACLFIFPIFANAFWVLSHNPLVAQRLDPIVNGNGTSGHVHSFVGSSAILGDQQNSSCTTAVVKDDRSRYWAPQLYYYSALNRTFASVPLYIVNTYYIQNGGPTMGRNPKIIAFPFGLKMIAGNAMNFDAPLADSTAAKAISFICLNYKTKNVVSATIPNSVCPQGLRLQIIFPSCWDGINLDSPNHQSHVSYPINGQPDYGDCPKTHPVKLATLRYEFVFATNYITDFVNGALVLSNGDTKGYSFHADFFSGWNVTTLQAGINQCTGKLFRDVERCPPFIPSLDRKSQCKTDQILKEKVFGRMANLPGCNPIRNGQFQGAGTCQKRSDE